jgi:hypothetical protein
MRKGELLISTKHQQTQYLEQLKDQFTAFVQTPDAGNFKGTLI